MADYLFDEADAALESWRDVSDRFGYQVSDFGRVRTRRRSGCAKGRTVIIADEWMIMTPISTRDGYLSINLRMGGRRIESRRIHDLVLRTFVGPKPEGCQACHNN